MFIQANDKESFKKHCRNYDIYDINNNIVVKEIFFREKKLF